jgi:hypothetical protein
MIPIRTRPLQELSRPETLGPILDLATLTSCNRRPEDVRVLAIVVAELKLGNIERHVFGADFVEAANDTALEDGPEALNRVGVDSTDDILPNAVIDRSVRVVGQPIIDSALVNSAIIAGAPHCTSMGWNR